MSAWEESGWDGETTYTLGWIGRSPRYFATVSRRADGWHAQVRCVVSGTSRGPHSGARQVGRWELGPYPTSESAKAATEERIREQRSK